MRKNWQENFGQENEEEFQALGFFASGGERYWIEFRCQSRMVGA